MHWTGPQSSAKFEDLDLERLRTGKFRECCGSSNEQILTNTYIHMMPIFDIQDVHDTYTDIHIYIYIHIHVLLVGDWNMTFIFPYIGNTHPSWLIFFRGVGQLLTRTNEQCDLSLSWLMIVVDYYTTQYIDIYIYIYWGL